ncbi:oxygen-independent coproporphyrinogen III oxidase [Candidatus Symbiobacter mobilis]|uniref:Coproporphyrinogen-III oxidase n=1 Tax=Candidatus Symbiobacter mobilis CR TaxID=946483 RepID=U5NDV2_9BURK|nr:oxygen-independent coproporphyrinogen III oxidase [Candidatus Symbiobacter mobilis]AGX88388.1 oxygen-independent coproporphyrinogen III oxidase [Candidatus Symbiobacter mobilis CR]
MVPQLTGPQWEALLRRYDVTGPRYTSYPTADRFSDTFTAQDYRGALLRLADAPQPERRPLSLYVHLPFCQSLCYFCACNKIVTRHHDVVDDYLQRLREEMALHAATLGGRWPVRQLHLGGGSPSFLHDAQLGTLMEMLREHFDVQPGCECAIELDPRAVDAARLRVLRELGFDRISFGVQDFAPAVQQAVHRTTDPAQVDTLMQAARDLDFASVNIDLIYGLPLQTTESFAHTLEHLVRLRPDRVAVYAYAHLPQRFPSQRRIDESALPDATTKVSLLALSMSLLTGAGYQYIGMDHFALPGDALAVAQREGRLQRNFQGYSTHPDCDLIGLGVSAISKVGITYSQNAKTIEEYAGRVTNGEFAVVRGVALTRDDLVRRAIIMAWMCQGRVDFAEIEAAHLVDFRRDFAREIDLLRTASEEGLVRIDDDALIATDTGSFFLRAIAMVFDRHLAAQGTVGRFSRIL